MTDAEEAVAGVLRSYVFYMPGAGGMRGMLRMTATQASQLAVSSVEAIAKVGKPPWADTIATNLRLQAKLTEEATAYEGPDPALLRAAADEVERLRDALGFFAQDENWKRDGACDPNSGRFSGAEVARRALTLSSQHLPTPGE